MSKEIGQFITDENVTVQVCLFAGPSTRKPTTMLQVTYGWKEDAAFHITPKEAVNLIELLNKAIKEVQRVVGLNDLPFQRMAPDISKLKEFGIYLVHVAHRADNPIHEAVLYMGFKSGGYCMIYSNTYEEPVKMQDVYYLKIVKTLGEFTKP